MTMTIQPEIDFLAPTPARLHEFLRGLGMAPTTESKRRWNLDGVTIFDVPGDLGIPAYDEMVADVVHQIARHLGVDPLIITADLTGDHSVVTRYAKELRSKLAELKGL